MFKRLLSSLRNKNQPADTAPDEPAQEREMIVAYDAHGQEMHIARNEWREKVFLPDLEKNWDDADALYNAILMGLKDGFGSDLVAAAERLVDIDRNPERSHTLHGIVLMETGHLDAAEQTLREGMDKSGATGTLLTNLAKVFAERGEDKRADETLWQAIQTDPNLDNGLLWWVSIQRERGGENAYIEGLRSVAAMPGSWRAQLWMARFYLEHNETDKARALYEEVLSGGRYDAEALYMISGDLGKNGQIPLLIALVAPHYDIQKHDPKAGINLLQAYLEQGQTDQGLTLLNQLYALNFAPFKQHLDYYSQAFEEKRCQTEPVQQVAPDDVKSQRYPLRSPFGITAYAKPTGCLTKNPKRQRRSVSLRYQKYRMAPQPRAYSVKMSLADCRVQFRSIWLKPYITGVIMQRAPIF
ncbi:tetratricopeptide repeat protein [Pantoea ananatis]